MGENSGPSLVGSVAKDKSGAETSVYRSRYINVSMEMKPTN